MVWWRVLVLAICAPFLALYFVCASVISLIIWILCLPVRRMPFSGILERFVMYLHIAPWSPLTDSLWMPLWKALVKTPTWYCEVDGDSVGVPQNVVDLPIRRDGFTRFVFFSDTHSKHELIDIPDGDVLCHMGDVFLRGSKGRCCCRDLRNTARFFKNQPHRTKILVGGNHDRALEALGTPGVEEHFGPGVRYLLHSGTACEGLSVFGTPFSQPSGSANRAFQGDAAPLDACPQGVHVLLSHSKLTEAELSLLRPRLHAYGHFHQGYGMKVKRIGGHTVLCLNASICDAKYRAVRRPIVVDIRVHQN